MALVLLEGFETERNDFHLDRVYGFAPWNQVSGRDGGRAIRGSTSTQWVPFWTQATQENNWVIGVDMFGQIGSSPDGGIRFSTGGNIQFTITFEKGANDGQDIGVTFSDGSTTWTSPVRLIDGKWHYVEFVVTIRDGVNGSFEMFVDDSSVYSEAGIDTAQQGTDGADEIEFGLSGTIRYDNIYFVTGTTAPTTRQGPIFITHVLPDGDGSENQWDIDGAASAFSLVDDDPDLGSFQADTINADSANLKQLFTYQTMSAAFINPHASINIVGVSVTNWGAMDGSGTRDVKVRFKDTSSATPVNGSGTWSLVGTTQQHYREVWAENPVTTAPFTRAEIDAMEVGVETVT